MVFSLISTPILIDIMKRTEADKFKDKMNREKVQWYLNPVIVVLLLFFVLGPFALPLLYKSPGFSKTLRIILTLIVTIYTLGLIFASLEIGREVYIKMEEYRDILEQM